MLTQIKRIVRNKHFHVPQNPCMVDLFTFTIQINQMDPIGCCQIQGNVDIGMQDMGVNYGDTNVIPLMATGFIWFRGASWWRMDWM